MRSFPENIATEYAWGHIMETHEIMCLVKRSLYEFCFAVPTRQVGHLSEERPLLRVRFKEQCQMPGLVLKIEEVEDFFDGLSCLMEYVRDEETRRQEQL
jgi:hypothetical protein